LTFEVTAHIGDVGHSIRTPRSKFVRIPFPKKIRLIFRSRR